jgi:shikimate dehydrogenase
MRAAVLGAPISHSLSPTLHRAAYVALGLRDWTYEAIECDEAGLAALLARCGPEWAGLSLTMPLKRAVLPLLDEAEPLVGDIGAANTVIFTRGRRAGYNTDVPGMAQALAEAGLPGPAGRWSPGAILIVGGGATATSALAATRDLAGGEVSVAVRDPARCGALVAAAQRLGVRVRLTGFGQPTGQPTVLISTVPSGAADVYAGLLDAGVLRPSWVFDVVYHPWPTALATAARRAGARVIGGFDLLLHQAAGQVTLMTGRPAPLPEMRAAGLAALGG